MVYMCLYTVYLTIIADHRGIMTNDTHSKALGAGVVMSQNTNNLESEQTKTRCTDPPPLYYIERYSIALRFGRHLHFRKFDLYIGEAQRACANSK